MTKRTTKPDPQHFDKIRELLSLLQKEQDEQVFHNFRDAAAFSSVLALRSKVDMDFGILMSLAVRQSSIALLEWIINGSDTSEVQAVLDRLRAKYITTDAGVQAAREAIRGQFKRDPVTGRRRRTNESKKKPSTKKKGGRNRK